MAQLSLSLCSAEQAKRPDDPTFAQAEARWPARADHRRRRLATAELTAGGSLATRTTLRDSPHSHAPPSTPLPSGG
jgi:hypothetical protein